MKAVSAEEAVAAIPNGATVMVGGFMGVGTPERLLDELVRQRKSGLSLISNDAALPGKGVGKLFDAALVSPRDREPHRAQPEGQQQMMAKQISVDLVPQGTLRGADTRRRLRARRRADADRRRHDGRAKASARSRSTARPICWRLRCAPNSRWSTPSLPTISATSLTSSPRATSILSWRWRPTPSSLPPTTSFLSESSHPIMS